MQSKPSARSSPFPLRNVRLTDAPLCSAAAGEAKYLLRLDADRLLANFRACAGLDTRGKRCYGGWERGLIGGHTMGHYLTALSQAECDASLPLPMRRALRERLDTVLAALRECQLHSRGRPGFLFGAPCRDESNVELQFDMVEQGRSQIETEAWVPWYTMHKILAGLIAAWELTGSETAARTALDLGIWAAGRAARWSAQTRRTVQSIEYGGMSDALYELYGRTGDERFREGAEQFNEWPLLRSLRSGVPDALNGLHANTTIPKFLGALNGWRTTGNTELLECAIAFFDTVTTRHSYITGGNSEWEHFGPDNMLDAKRTNTNCETCNAYNMLKLAAGLYGATGEARFLDDFSRTFVNSILASRDPDTGMTTYFQPMASGYFKVYSSPEASFWCCTGTGMESFTKLGGGIYYRRGEEITVALYLSSELCAPSGVLRQHADLPAGRAELTCSGEIPSLRLRIPDWAADFTVYKNGVPAAYTREDGFARLSEPLREGEKLLLLPPRLTAEALPDCPGAIAFRWGPYVLSADLGREDLRTALTGVDVTVPAAVPDGFTEEIALPYPVERLKSAPERCFAREGEEFRLIGTALRFAPHYRRGGERYGIYFRYHYN